MQIMMEENNKFLIFGLGNYESKYAGTRHNIGFEVVAALAEKLKVTFSSDRYASVARGRYKGRILVLILPTTFMNLSGKAVKYWTEKEKVNPQNIMVISDDLDLPLGTLRIRPKGGGGSHNGLNNIIELLGHNNFPRLRFGIGHEFSQGYQIDFVLGKFDSAEMSQIKPSIDKATQICLSFATDGLQRTMNMYNTKETN